MPTYDEIALRLLLTGKQEALKELADRAAGRVECPSCGDRGPHDHNGSVVAPEFNCAACGCVFEDEGVSV